MLIATLTPWLCCYRKNNAVFSFAVKFSLSKIHKTHSVYAFHSRNKFISICFSQFILVPPWTSKALSFSFYSCLRLKVGKWFDKGCRKIQSHELEKISTCHHLLDKKNPTKEKTHCKVINTQNISLKIKIRTS